MQNLLWMETQRWQRLRKQQSQQAIMWRATATPGGRPHNRSPQSSAAPSQGERGHSSALLMAGPRAGAALYFPLLL